MFYFTFSIQGYRCLKVLDAMSHAVNHGGGL